MTTLQMTRGDTQSFTMTVTRGGSAVDLTGASVWFTGKSAYSDADGSAVFQKTVGNGITISAPATGVIAFRLAHADTASLTNERTRLYFDVQLYEPGTGELTTLDSGLLWVNPDVTLATS